MPCCPFLLSGLRSILESDAGTRCRNDCRRRDHSPLRQRKLESDADHLSRNDRCRRNHSSLPQRKLESDADHLSRNGRCRRAIPHCCDDGAAVIRKSGPEIKNRCSNEAVSGQNPAAIPKFTPSNQESLHAKGRKRGKTCSDSQIDPLNQESMHESGSKPGKPCIDSQVWPGIKNRCTQEGVNGEILASIRKFGP